jgi:hypothetical protein
VIILMVTMMIMMVAKLSVLIPYCSKPMTYREAAPMTNCTTVQYYRHRIT